jgi:tRNA modification GTPase
VVLLIIDGSLPLTDEDLHLYDQVHSKPHLLLINKMDLSLFYGREIAAKFPAENCLFISALRGTGLDDLKTSLKKLLIEEETLPDLIPNLRHRQALVQTMEALVEAHKGIQEGLPPDLVAVDLRAALDHLGEVVGATTTEELLNRIFSRFCIGK